MEVDITASLKTLITVCFWMNNDYVKPEGELLPVVATRTNYEWCKYKILIFQAQVAIKIENKPSRAIPAKNSRQQVNLTHHSMESTFVLLQKVETFCKKSQKRLRHQGKGGRMRRRWTQFYNQSPTKKKFKTTKTIIINLSNTSQNLFYYTYNRRSKLFHRYSGPQRMNQPCMEQNQPCMCLKSSKKQAQAASIWLDKKSFPKQKNEEIPQKNHFRLQRNGTFFLLLRRFFKLPDLEFPLHGCNLTNFFWNRTLNKKRTKPPTSKKEQKQQGRIIHRKESVPSRIRVNACFWRSAACSQAYQKFSRKSTLKKGAMWKFF